MTVPAAMKSPPRTVRLLNVDIIEARDLLPKDGQGSSSPYVIADFDGQKKRTSTKHRDLNPVWNETLEFVVSDPEILESEDIEIEVFTDRKGSGAAGAKKRQSLGRVKLCGTQFARRGEEGLVYFPLQKKSVFSWIRGEIALRIYYYDEVVAEEQLQPPREAVGAVRVPVPTEVSQQDEPPLPPVIVREDSPLPPEAEANRTASAPPHGDGGGIGHSNPPQPEIKKMQAGRAGCGGDRSRVPREPTGDFYTPKAIPGKRVRDHKGRTAANDLVDPIHYLYVSVVKARNLPAAGIPYAKVQANGHCRKTKPACYRPGSPDPEWRQVFAFEHRSEAAAANLQVSVWDAPSERFLGDVAVGFSDIPVRDPPDSPLATRWHPLQAPGGGGAEIQLAFWIGTQADEAFPESWSTDTASVAHTRPKVYQSPKLWYLRVKVVEAQDLQINASSYPPLVSPDIRVKAQLGFQSRRTRPGSIGSQTTSSSSLLWLDEFFFVASEPLEEQLILIVEDCTTNAAGILGYVVVPLASIEQRLDERHVASKWFGLEGSSSTDGPRRPGPPAPSSYCGRINLLLCLEGGYHVLDEAAHVCSDFRPTAQQLWRPPVGILEVGILGARGLLPMNTSRGGGKGSTDAYCVAKYAKKWVRTKTVPDSFDPRWNEQYTWQVYDPCTVLTIGVFDNRSIHAVADAAAASENPPDCRIGKVRIRISTLENNKVYLSSYPLLVLLRNGVRKMGDVELAVRFTCPSLLPETCAMYGQPLLPRMHYLRPVGVAQQEALRGAAVKLVAAWLAKSEPPLGPEVVRFMLDADSHAWSMRKSKANWFRILAVLGWVVGLARWLDDIRRWRNAVTTVLVHLLYLVLVWYPDLIVPTGFLYVILIGVWYYRFRPKIPSGMDTRLSYAEMVDPDELDEEFDTMPSSKPPDIIRARYDRLRVLAGRVQKVLGDIATQGERVQALVSWRDPRATRLFIGICLLLTVALYTVPPKMVAVALGFYFLRHPMFRDPMPPARLNFFRRLPSLSDRLL